jgi:hypothetical protein
MMVPGIIYAIIAFVLQASISLPEELWLAIWIGFLLLFLPPVVKLLLWPYKVTVTESNNLIFKSVFSKTQISMNDIISVVSYSYFLKHRIKYKGGQIYLLNGINDIRELTYRILKYNSDVNIERKFLI